MALKNNGKTVETRTDNQQAEQEPESEENLEQLELEVKNMAEKILEYRATMPDQLKSTLASILSTQRSNLPRLDDGCEPGPSGEHNADEEIGLDKKLRQTEEKKIRLLKEKISSNISAMPVLTKRMKDFISRIEKLDSCNGAIIHPAFKKRKLIDP